MGVNCLNKKAEVSTSFLVTMIILVIGFTVLVIFFSNIGGTGEMDRTVCHNSVILRATMPAVAENLVSLQCKTNKLCITNGLLKFTSSCADFKGEKGITTIKAKNIDQVEKVYAQEILSCWQTMGEGKVSLFNSGVMASAGLGNVYPSCVICSRIAIDPAGLAALGITAEDINIEEYMMTHKIPNKEITYYEYIAGNGGKVSVLEDKKELSDADKAAALKDLSDLGGFAKTITDNSKDLASSTPVTDSEALQNLNLQEKSTAILFMQISSPTQSGSFEKWVYGNLAVLGIGAKFAPGSFFSITRIPGTAAVAGTATSVARVPTGLFDQFGRPLMRTLTKPGVAGQAATSGSTKFALGPAAQIYAAISIITLGFMEGNTAWQRSVTAGYCGDISTGTEARSGCSVVRAVPYNPEDIAKYCSVIESIP